MTNPNINVDTVQECNLLCKCIIDYIENTSIDYQKTNKAIELSKGNFINFRDTNYEASLVNFYNPSITTIDGERFDMEVIITHTNPSHIHYYLDEGNQQKNFHYHKGVDPHESINLNKNNKVYLHILYNIGDHKNTRINNFFLNLYIKKIQSI